MSNLKYSDLQHCLRVPYYVYGNAFLTMRATCKQFHDSCTNVLEEYALEPWHEAILPHGIHLKDIFLAGISKEFLKLSCKFVGETTMLKPCEDSLLAIPVERIAMWLFNNSSFDHAQKKTLLYIFIEIIQFTLMNKNFMPDNKFIGMEHECAMEHGPTCFIRLFLLNILFNDVYVVAGNQTGYFELNFCATEILYLLHQDTADMITNVYSDEMTLTEWGDCLHCNLHTAVIVLCQAMVAAIRDFRIAILFRKRGNQAFQNGDYMRAVEWYSAGLWFNMDNEVLLCNRALANLKAHRAIHGLLDAQNAYTLSIHNPYIQHKAINHILDACVACNIQSQCAIEDMCLNINGMGMQSKLLHEKIASMRTKISRMPAWNISTILGPSHLGLYVQGQNLPGIYTIRDLSYMKGIPVIMRQGTMITLELLENMMWSPMGVGIKFPTNLFRLIELNEHHAMDDSRVWSEVSMWAACLFVINTNAIVVFQDLSQLRWANTAMPMNMHWAEYHMNRTTMFGWHRVQEFFQIPPALPLL